MIIEENIPYTADEIKAMVKTCEKYNKALEKAKKLYGKYCINNVLEDLFPELKENKEERIRKDIISFLKDFEKDHYRSVNFNSWIDWLEKQDEKKHADEIEPKFKVGDWIVQENIGTYKIIEVCESWYEVIDNQNNRYSIGFDKEHMCHFWSINDANDGDVLYFNDDTIVIFKDLYNSTTFHSYCHIEDDIFDISKDEMPDWWESEGFTPATKEQRELLLKKMNEAGYRWNAERKEVTNKESKDERIRKAIKKALQVRCDGSRIISDEPVTLEEAIAWLEKQKGD